jgi:hypothetical protein
MLRPHAADTAYVLPIAARSAFAGFRFPREVIVLAVRWYLRFGLSYRDVEALLAERGIEVDHVSVPRWVKRFTPLLADAARFGRTLGLPVSGGRRLRDCGLRQRRERDAALVRTALAGSNRTRGPHGSPGDASASRCGCQYDRCQPAPGVRCVFLGYGLTLLHSSREAEHKFQLVWCPASHAVGVRGHRHEDQCGTRSLRRSFAVVGPLLASSLPLAGAL